MSAQEKKEMKEQLDELLANSFIQPSKSPWGASVLFVPKRNGKMRMCWDNFSLKIFSEGESPCQSHGDESIVVVDNTREDRH